MDRPVSTFRIPFIHEYKDRHGKVRRYVRQRGKPKVTLNSVPGSPNFMIEYAAALTASPKTKQSRFKTGTLASLAEDYFKAPEFVNLKPSSKRTYRYVLDPILTKDGHRLVCDMPADKARKIINEIGEKRPGMANLARAVMRKLMRFAVLNNLRTDNPFDVVATYKLGTHHTWTESEIATYMAKWPLGTRQRLALDLLLYTGQRVGDAARLKHSDIINNQICVVQDKTGADLRIPIHPALARSLKAGPSLGENLITDAKGNPVKDRSLAGIVLKAAALAGLPRHCVPHGLRKAALRHLAEHGATSKQIAAISGHKTIGEIERYTKKADQVQLARAAIRLLPDEREQKSG